MSEVKYLHLYTGCLGTNTYVVINGSEGFVVDPADCAEEIYDIFAKNKAKPVAILLTHGHFDHIGAVNKLCAIASEKCGEEPQILIHKDDAEMANSYKNLGFAKGIYIEKFTPDILLNGGESLNIAGLEVKIIHTPGHTKGGVCYIVENKIFVGDTIFFNTYGRCDLPGGDKKVLKNSIVNKLFRLNGNYTLLPGHGEPTTLDFERMNNPILENLPKIMAD